MNGNPLRTRDEFPLTPAETWALLRRYPVLVLGSGILCVLFVLFWIGGQTPQWSASSTLLLRRDKAMRDGAVAPLHAMMQAPETASEIALLRSHGPASETVRHATGADPRGETGQHLGLTTLVDDLSNQPLATFLRQVFGGANPDGRLRASLNARTGPGPREVHVEFVEESLVRLSVPAGLGGNDHVQDFAWRPGTTLDYLGLDLVLEPQGDVRGKAFRVRAQHEREAVRSLMERISARETEPGSGLIKVGFQDSDPHRAAEVVNALVANYLRRNEAQQRERTRARLGQVEGELERVSRDLQRSHEELVRLQRDSPLSINADESIKSITLSLTSRSVEYTDVQLELTLVEDAIEALEAGELDGLSKLAETTTDRLTRILIEQIGHLQAQAQVQERSDAGQYRLLLQQRLLDIEQGREELVREVDGFVQALRALGDQGLAGVGMLRGDGPSAGRMDPTITVLLDRILRLDTERTELLASDFMPSHPDVLKIDAAVSDNLAKLQELLSARVDYLREQIDQFDRFALSTKTELDGHPESERRVIVAALERFNLQVLDNLESLREALTVRQASLAQDLARFEADLALLPASERMQLEPLQRVDNAKERVAELLETRDTIKMMAAFLEQPAEVIDPAAPSARRDSPRMTFNLMLGFFLGLGLGLTLAFVIDRGRGSVESADELEQTLGLTVLGSLPSMDLGDDGTKLRRLREAFEEGPTNQLAGAFRALRTNLSVLLSARKDARTLGITSSATGEGKSVTTFGLALGFALAGRRVLLVDGNGAASGRGKKREGLVQLLSGKRDAGDVVVPSGFAGLQLLAAGGPADHVADACSRPGAEQCFQDLARGFDLVLVDMPAIEHEAEALALARHLDSLVLVCRKSRTPRRMVRRALAHLDRLGVPVLGAVFNAVGRLALSRRALRLVRPEDRASSRKRRVA